MAEPTKPLTGLARAVFDQAIRNGYGVTVATELGELAAASGRSSASALATVRACAVAGKRDRAAQHLRAGASVASVRADLRGQRLGIAASVALLADEIYTRSPHRG